MNNLAIRSAGIVAFTTVLSSAAPAMADGEFLQFDLSPDSSTLVGSVVRGDIGTALSLSLFDGGGALSANTTYSWNFPALGEGALIRLGPTARLDQSDDFNLGAKVVFERWSPTDWGGVFMLADYNTIQNEYLLLTEVSGGQNGLSASFAIQGDDESFRENTLMFGYNIMGSDLRLRLGYKFESEQVVFGFSINTF